MTRHRVSNWPTRNTIERIVSMGCSVVPKPRPESQYADNEFRFSFSNAELILFREMILEQRNCFIAFKALVKRAIGKLKLQDDEMRLISTYHLKTIFLWACETIETKHWKTTRGWATCLLFLLDQLIICLGNKSLPSYFITECNLLDGIKMLKSHQIIIDQVRMRPLEYAVEFLDSMDVFDMNAHKDYHKSRTNGSSLQSFNSAYNTILEPFSYQNSCQHEITNSSKAETLIYEREKDFLQKLLKVDNPHSCLFRRKPCSLLTSFANWYKENMNGKLSLFKDMTLFDVIRLENVHGLPIHYNQLVDNFERKSTEICTGEIPSVQTNTVYLNESLWSKAILILFLMNSGQLEKARDELQYVISKNNLNASGLSFDISNVVMETGYTWLFGYGTMNSIEEWKNAFNKCKVNVSADFFFRFMLSMCHKKLGTKQGLECQLEALLNITETNSHSLHRCDYLLLGEVAEMVGQDSLAPEIYKSWFVSTFEVIRAFGS